MMRKWLLFLFLLKMLPIYAENGFALSEHLAQGKTINLQFIDSTKQNPILHLANGLVLHYADIISLGDLYAVVNHPISTEKTERNKQQRFLSAFYMLARDKKALTEAPKLLEVINNELAQIEQAIAEGQTAEQAYQTIANEIGRQINCLTGGGCMTSKWWLIPGRFLTLAMNNIDHFSPQAEQVYKIGHAIALQQAVIAHYSQKNEDLELAYAFEAYADHFLSDLYAAGHQRTPRIELPQQVTPALVGLLLTNFMHNEENQMGLLVENGFGQQWTMFGDFSYFNPQNKLNSYYLQDALQNSVDEIFTAFKQGEPLELHYFFLPHAVQSERNITPLFYWDECRKKLLRRKNLSDPFAKDFTSDWWGWSTLIALKKVKGLPVEMKHLWQQAMQSKLHRLGNEE